MMEWQRTFVEGARFKGKARWHQKYIGSTIYHLTGAVNVLPWLGHPTGTVLVTNIVTTHWPKEGPDVWDVVVHFMKVLPHRTIGVPGSPTSEQQVKFYGRVDFSRLVDMEFEEESSGTTNRTDDSEAGARTDDVSAHGPGTAPPV